MSIETPPYGLVVSHISVPVSTGGPPLRAYLARPDNSERVPGIVVVHEAFGLVPHIEDVCRRLGHAGFAAIAPDLYRKSPHPPEGGDMAALMATVAKLDDQVVLSDLGDTVDYLKHQPYCTNRIGAIGFCMGGSFAMLLSMTTQKLSAVVPFYGPIIRRPLAGAPEGSKEAAAKLSPLEHAADLSCAFEGHYGGKDPHIPATDVDALRSKLLTADRDVRVHVYAEAGHAFFNDHRENYHESSARLAWQRLMDFLDRTLID